MRRLGEGLALLRSALSTNRPMRLALWWQLALLAGGAFALPFDRRVVLGLSPWVKPMKFEVSVIVYLLTIALMLYGLRWHRSEQDGAGLPRLRRWLSIGFAVAMTVENTTIALQSARGVRSHMNYTSLLNGVLFGLMGVFIVVNTVLVAWLLVLWFAARARTPPAVTWGVRLGLLTLLLGSVEGFVMVQHGGHTVGGNDGLAGLYFLNWSRGHGDLRVAHFFALHALQVFPLAGLLFAGTRLKQVAQVLATWLFATFYVGGVWWLFAEAMHGRPLLHS